VVVLYEQQRDNGSNVLTLVASKPILGTLSYKNLNGEKLSLDPRNWVCTNICAIILASESGIRPESILFSPQDTGAKSMLGQFFLGRDGEYGIPIRQANK